MSNKSFPAISSLSCRSLSTNTLTMTTTKLKKHTVIETPKAMRKPVEPNVPDQPVESVKSSEKVVCPYCKGYVSDVDTFCIHCGREFTSNSYRYCIRCGQGIGADARLCPYCGVRLQK